MTGCEASIANCRRADPIAHDGPVCVGDGDSAVHLLLFGLDDFEKRAFDARRESWRSRHMPEIGANVFCAGDDFRAFFCRFLRSLSGGLARAHGDDSQERGCMLDFHRLPRRLTECERNTQHGYGKVRGVPERQPLGRVLEKAEFSLEKMDFSLGSRALLRP